MCCLLQSEQFSQSKTTVPNSAGHLHGNGEKELHIQDSRFAASRRKQDRQCTYKRNIEALSRNYYCPGKALIITYSERVSVALVIQRAKRMRRIILSSVGCLALPFLSTLWHKRHDFRKEVIEHERVFRLFLRFLSEIFPILRRIKRDIIVNIGRYSCKLPVTFVTF